MICEKYKAEVIKLRKKKKSNAPTAPWKQKEISKKKVNLVITTLE